MNKDYLIKKLRTEIKELKEYKWAGAKIVLCDKCKKRIESRFPRVKVTEFKWHKDKDSKVFINSGNWKSTAIYQVHLDCWKKIKNRLNIKKAKP